MAIQKASGFVLRAQDFQETSRIVVLFSAEFGRISLLAKGARRLESRFGGALDLLNHIEVVFYASKGLKLLKEAHLLDGFSGLKQDYERLEAALRAARSLNLLLRDGQRDPRIYKLFHELLLELEGQQGEPELLLLGFKLKMIDLLGFGLELEHCAVCRQPLKRAPALWLSPEAGGLVCGDCHRPEDLPLDRRLARSWQMILRLTLNKLQRLSLERGLIVQGHEALDRFIAFHLQPI